MSVFVYNKYNFFCLKVMIESFKPEIFFNSDKGSILPSEKSENAEKFPDYEEKFGHLAEKIIREAVDKKGIIVEKVDKGTKFEDCDQKVDFWIKFVELEEPIGIQFTTNPKKYTEKKDFLRGRNFIARKVEQEGAQIKWFGKANVVVVLENHVKMLDFWKKMELENKKAEEVVSNEFVRDFLTKVYFEIKEVNAAKYFILMKLGQTMARKIKAQKLKGN